HSSQQPPTLGLRQFSCLSLPSSWDANSFPVLSKLSCFFNEGDNNTSGEISPARAPPGVPTAILSRAHDLPNNPGMVNYSGLMENENMNPRINSSFCIRPNSDMPKIETSLENNAEAVNYPTFLGNDNDHGSSSSSVLPPTNFAVEKFVLIEMPGKETNMEGNSQTMYYPALLGNIQGPDTASSPVSSTSRFLLEKVIIIEKPEKAAETRMESNSGTVNSSILDNASGQHATSPSISIPPSFVFLDKEFTIESFSFWILLTKILIKVETSMENSSDTMYLPTLWENDSGQDSFSLSICIPLNYTYLGDPRRKVKILQAHLVAAQKKARPEHAACYLVRILFSKEVLINSSVGGNVQGRQPLDPNKLAAIREYLTTVFRTYDLREYGRDWKTCLFNISSLIRYLHYKSRRASDFVYRSSFVFQQNNVGRYKSPTSSDAAAAAASAGQGDESGGSVEGSSQLVPQASAPSTHESGDPQQCPDAAPEEMNQPSTDNSLIPYEALDYLGNPRRNIQMPHLILDVAKGKSCPELAARHLIRNLFTEDILIRSTVYGDLAHGMSALNSNRINALREFLQDNYPSGDFSEAGYDWRMCVSSINSYICILRSGLWKSVGKSQPHAAASSSGSEPKR
ncbi:LOW QUALITY PROTEIN: BEN domain-containing protein 2, partial [Nycticebus coucang]|uniref:LOW QUALITY PROTEIN: BEN domain-containing protein 2 n=1 Tax=Nycticebus coucang TaxID=9470 RepID=UPI00234DF0B4